MRNNVASSVKFLVGQTGHCFLHSLLLIALLFNFAAGQSLPEPFEPDHFAQLEFAHRGGYAYGPENALSTITRNLRHFGVDAIEVDIRMTADNHLVLFHDESIGRILDSPEDKPLAEMTLAEIKAIPYRDESFGQIFVPDFQTFLDTMLYLAVEEKKQFVVELDFKPHGKRTRAAVDELMEFVAKAEETYGDTIYHFFYIGTFYPDVLKEVRNRSEKIVTAFAVSNSPDASKLLARIAILLSPRWVRKHRASGIEPNMCMVNPRYLRRWRKRNCFVNAWTANKACEKDYLDQFQVGITTNCPLSTCEPDPSDQIKPKKWCKTCE